MLRPHSDGRITAARPGPRTLLTSPKNPIMEAKMWRHYSRVNEALQEADGGSKSSNDACVRGRLGSHLLSFSPACILECRKGFRVKNLQDSRGTA